MVFLRYVILFTALQSLTLAWKMDREVGSDEPTRWYRLESRIRDSCLNPISSRDCGSVVSKEVSGKNNKAFINREVFPCENSNCVSYDKVCDLIDHCGDFSDEKNCHNHYLCDNSSNEIIKKSQVCDGVVHCSNHADECSTDCPTHNKQIIHTTALAVCSWTIGITGTLINGFVITRNALHILTTKKHTKAKLFSTVSVLLIGIGDTLMSLYLVGISIENVMRRENFCEKEYEWLTSMSCEIYGVISTLGSQLSLFSMVMFSVYGALAMRKMRKSPSASKAFCVQLAIICIALIGVSLLIALLPISTQLQETYFYNGFYIPNAKLFLGPRRNHEFQPILNTYYATNTTITDVIEMKKKL